MTAGLPKFTERRPRPQPLQARAAVQAATPQLRLQALAQALCNGADWRPARRAQESGAMEFEMVNVCRAIGGLL